MSLANLAMHITPHEQLRNRPGRKRKLDYDAVVQGLADGYTIKKLASKLNCPPRSVDSVIRWLRTHYGLTNTAHLVAHFLRNGWVD